MQVDRVDQCAPDVVLALVERCVADAYGPRPRSRTGARASLRQVTLAAYAVEHLQGPLGGDVADEVEEVVRLVVDAERVQRPQRERGVADPRVAVVPVAQAARRLRQGRRRAATIAPLGAYARPFSVSALRWRYDRHGWSGNCPCASHSRQYLAVKSSRSVASCASRGAGVAPAERHVRRVALAQRGSRPRPSGALEPEPQVGREAQHGVVGRAGRDGGAIPRPSWRMHRSSAVARPRPGHHH